MKDQSIPIQISLPKSFVEKMDKHANEMSLSRSAFIRVAVIEKISQLIKEQCENS